MSKNLPTSQRHTTFIEWAQQNKDKMVYASFVRPEARERMLKKNLEYILSADLKEAWNTPEGIESIQKALEESIYYAATMPETGSIIPFKNTVEFCPAVECFRSALTTGEKAPCTNIVIECIYSNDKYEFRRDKETQNVIYSNSQMLPRGEIIGVAVQVFYKNGSVDGALYDIKSLLEKAAEHSASYKYYLNDMAALAKAQSEGKDHITKWEKKYYAKDITSPYEGADREKMFIKLAGKSFLKPIFKQHMINCVIDENEADTKDDGKSATPLQIVNRSIENIKDDLSNSEKKKPVAQITDAEIVDDAPPKKAAKEPAKLPAQKSTKRSDLFAD